MFKYLVFVFWIFSIDVISAQEIKGNKHITVFVTKLELTRDKVNQFIESHQGAIISSEKSESRNYLQFNIHESDVKLLDSLLRSCGNILVNNYNSENKSQAIKTAESRIETLKYENELYKKLLADTLSNGSKPEELRQKISQNMRQMTSTEVEIFKYKKQMEAEMVAVSLTINDEQTTPSGGRIRLVNMPGVEYGYLMTENPKSGVSLATYNGATIKYMFTRGKSYINIGVYKGSSAKLADSSSINELFVINFGQDFYPRNFGRGSKRYLNLYTGYQTGVLILHQSNDKNTRSVLNANLSLGLELIKTKHILIDNKISYFLPLNAVNHDLRGMLYQASFNFVF